MKVVISKNEAAIAFATGNEVFVSQDGNNWFKPKSLTEIDIANAFSYENLTRTFRCGDRFKILNGSDGEYILACVDSSSFALINLKNGNRFVDLVKSGCVMRKVPFDVVSKCAGGSEFELVSKGGE